MLLAVVSASWSTCSCAVPDRYGATTTRAYAVSYTHLDVYKRQARTYAAMLNAGITPVVHEFGSLGCSGDLAPLAHCALAAMGEGPVRLADGTPSDAASALQDLSLIHI